MNDSYIKDIIDKCLIDSSLDITQLLSLDARTNVMNNREKFFDSYVSYGFIKYRLFTPNEALRLFKSGNHNIEIVYHLSDNRKIELIDLFSLEESKKLFISLTSDDVKKKAFSKLLNSSYYIDDEYLLSFSDIMNGIDIVEEYLSSNQRNARGFLNYSLKISNILSNCNEKVQYRILDLFDKYNCFEYNFLSGIDNNLSIFEYIIKLPSIMNNPFNLSVYIESLNPKINIDVNRLYDILIDNGYKLSNQQLASLFFIAVEEKKKDFIYHIYNDIDDYKSCFCWFLLKYPKEQIPEKLYELFSDVRRFDIVAIASKFKNDLLFNCLDVVFEKIVETDKYDQSKKGLLCEKFLDYFNSLSYDINVNNNFVSCPNFIRFFCEHLNLKQDNFEKLISKFGYQIFKYLHLKNIQHFINFEHDKFDMVLKIFSKENTIIDSHKMDSLIEAVVQREFIFKQKNIYNIFSRIQYYIEKKEDFRIIYDEVISVVSQKRFNSLQKICFENGVTLEQLFIDLCNNNSDAMNVLHLITNLYISIKREDYTKKRSLEIRDELDLCKKYQKEWIQKKYLQIRDNYSIYIDIKCLNVNDLTDEQRALYDDKSQLEDIIAFKKNPKNIDLKNNIDVKNLKIFTELLNILYEKDKLKDDTKDSNAIYVYSFNPVKRNSLIEILSVLDFDSINDNLLSNKDAYNTLLMVFEKYKYIGIGSTFFPIRDNIDLDIGSQSIAGLINCFYVLYNEFCEKVSTDENLKQKLLKGYSMSDLFISDSSMTKLLEEGFVHEMSSNKYSFLLGNEDFRLIFANVGKNRASATADSRLSKVVKVIPKMYERSKISVPNIKDVITLENGKKIDVVIGSSDFMNLSVGERTKSCLRACGAFKDLWEFCLTDKNGFNIIYLDHDTGKFISRVSAVRNGNTIFENELRESVCAGFTNEDVVSANSIVSNMLVSMTMSDEFPIDNVLITYDYVMEPYRSQCQEVHTDRKKALYGLSFNYSSSDVFNAIVLSNGGVMMPILLGPDKCSLYDVCVSRVSSYFGSDIIRKVKQLHAINDLLDGISVDDMDIVDVSYNFDNLVCIANNQFYVIKQGDDVIDSFILDKCKNNEKVVCEFENISGGYIDEKNRSYS